MPNCVSISRGFPINRKQGPPNTLPLWKAKVREDNDSLGRQWMIKKIKNNINKHEEERESTGRKPDGKIFGLTSLDTSLSYKRWQPNKFSRHSPTFVIQL